MSPLLLIVIAPVIVGAVALLALLLGAPAAGPWEAFEERTPAPAPAAPARAA